MPEEASLSRTRLARLIADGSVRVNGVAETNPKARVAEDDRIEIVLDASEIADGSGAPLADALAGTPFSTALGTVEFGQDHELAVNPYRMLVWDGNAFAAPEDSP